MKYIDDNKRDYVDPNEWSNMSPHQRATILLKHPEISKYMWSISNNIIRSLPYYGIHMDFLSPDDIYQELSFYVFKKIVEMGDKFNPRLILSLISRHGNILLKKYKSIRKEYRVPKISIHDVPSDIASYSYRLSISDRFVIEAVKKVYREVVGEDYDPYWLTSKEAQYIRRKIIRRVRKELKEVANYA